ncbi:hypothetical protein [Sphingomonas parapaucimobilis]|uniref:hypothetical protein n=1 Tax=Sphingomonas parapaucimobilis TaxID=28213 RepID=UPI0035C804EA
MTGLDIVEQDFYTHGSYASQLAANYRVICDLMLRLSARFCQFDVLAPNTSPLPAALLFTAYATSCRNIHPQAG